MQVSNGLEWSGPCFMNVLQKTVLSLSVNVRSFVVVASGTCKNYIAKKRISFSIINVPMYVSFISKFHEFC